MPDSRSHRARYQQRTVRDLEQLAPANGEEIAAGCCSACLAGIIEESVFRGYLQRQFTAWAHGGAASGVVFSALLFGAAHGYQGVRNMVLLAVFGVLFSVLAILRRSLRAGIFAQAGTISSPDWRSRFLRAHHLRLKSESESRSMRRKNCCHFFHSQVVFFLTLSMHESIHSSTAI